MNNQILNNGQRFIFVTNVSENMIGKELFGIRFHREDYNNPKSNICGLGTIKNLCEYHLGHHNNCYIRSKNGNFFIDYIELIDENRYHYDLLNAIMLFKRTGFCYLNLHGTGKYKSMIRLQENYFVFGEAESPDFFLEEYELETFESFYNKICARSNCDKNYKLINNMIYLLIQSYRVENYPTKLMLRIIIMEALVDGQTEISFQIRRNMAVLLGKNKQESEMIFEDIKKIYKERSNFVHGSEHKINLSIVEKSKDYARRLICNLIEINQDIKDIRKKLIESGFGDNPYQVKF